MFLVLLIVATLGSTAAISIDRAPPILHWLCERHTATGGEGFPSGWCSGDNVCQWAGVVCLQDSQVVSVELTGANLQSPLDPRAYHPGVERLSLRSCRLTGTIESPFDDVSVLDLSDNSLVGPLPLDFFTAPQKISLAKNRLTSVGNLCESQYISALDLSENLFADDLTPCGATFSAELKRVILHDNAFTGVAPFSPGTVVFSAKNNQFSAVLDASPLQVRSSTFASKSLEKFGIVRADGRQRAVLSQCRIDQSTFADGTLVRDAAKWMLADISASELCKLQ